MESNPRSPNCPTDTCKSECVLSRESPAGSPVWFARKVTYVSRALRHWALWGLLHRNWT